MNFIYKYAILKKKIFERSGVFPNVCIMKRKIKKKDAEKIYPLESLFKLTPNIFSRYKKLNNKWSKEPQEVFLKADLEMRIYLGMALCFWIASGIATIFILLGIIQKETSSVIGWGITFGLTTYSGFVLFNMSNKKEAESNLEKMKYREALMNKKTTVRRLKEIETICERGVRENIIRHKYNNYLDDKKTYINLFKKLIDLTQNSIDDLNNVYETNKYYDYNINEQLEIETFYTVDAFKECEIMTNNLMLVLDDLSEVCLLMQKEKEPMIVVNKIELLLERMKTEKVKI